MSQGFGAQKMEAAVEALTSNGSQREPSMEEILASIRRIIEDNDAPSAKSSEKAVPEPVAASEALTQRNEAHGRGDAPSRQPSPDREEASPVQPVRHDEAPSADTSGDVETFKSELRETSVSEAASDAEAPGAHVAGSSSSYASTVDRGLMQRIAEVDAVPNAPASVESAGRVENKAHENEPRLPAAAERADEAKQGILSEYTGRKVAAAFGELNEAFEASRRRNFDQMAEEMLRPMLQDWLDNNLPTIVERLVREEIERIARGG
ncbi:MULTISPECIES: PopZ family protein [unclassified Nitratireductor]|uniref:PopZ family protein n=1 Tax=unclassified Nitratireductor TaxID=2641084 RepID=UPI0025F79C30|nr:PopZ family protein [Nitratireductor sp.]